MEYISPAEDALFTKALLVLGELWIRDHNKEGKCIVSRDEDEKKVS